MGFSLLGLAVSLAIFLPNLLLIPFPPRPKLESPAVPRVLLVLERAGQALCMTVPAITATGPIVWGWAVPVALAVLAYGALWIRYLRRGRSGSALFDTVLGIPVPMALAPVAAFLGTAAWLQNPWIALAAVVLAVGHIPTSLLAAREH
ncbi:hypothetical protein [Microbacterium paraoxydans]|uniref:hypothetical protein n=1 Tax=Microbacterium paraoxydans TaxID=199592 RepID=UPI0021A907AE|nr:hypothetical protein [Microbacterium paraoxydans]MCT2225534.1 hypothetical protein [Microbacterium paraoxydans]